MSARRVMRPNYDKAHRCPAWSGPAMRPGPDTSDCPGGYITIDYDTPGWQWRTHTCPSCGTVTLPDVVRRVDPAWLRIKVRRAWNGWRYRRASRRP